MGRKIADSEAVTHGFLSMGVSAGPVDQVMVKLMQEDEEGQLVRIIRFDMVAGLPPGGSEGMSLGDAGFDADRIAISVEEIDIDSGEFRGKGSGVNGAAGIADGDLQGGGRPLSGGAQEHRFDAPGIQLGIVNDFHIFGSKPRPE